MERESELSTLHVDSKLDENDIHFDYVNENPEIHALSSDPKSSDFSDKFYFNVGIDDKFGFDPENDWVDLYDFLTRNSH